MTYDQISNDEKLEIYRLNLRRYESEGREEQAEIQRRLIKKLEAQHA